MVTEPKIVVRFNFWYHPIMAERFAREPDFELRTCDLNGREDVNWAEFAEAHAYQISSAKDELPHKWFAAAPLLERCPNLLCVSTAGAGYDTVDLEACTKAGVLAVNQAGANAQSVAEHTVGALLDVARRLTESDRLLRRKRGFSREDIMGREITGKVLGLVGIGHIGRIVARMAAAFDMTVLAVDPYLNSRRDRPARCPVGELGRTAGIGGFRFAALPPRREHAEHDRRRGVCPDEAGRDFRHDRAWRNPQRGRLGRRARFRAPGRRGARRVGRRAASPGASAPQDGQRRRDLSHRRRHAGGACQHGDVRGGANHRLAPGWRSPPRLLNPEAWPLYAERYNRIFGAEPGSDAGRARTEELAAETPGD